MTETTTGSNRCSRLSYQQLLDQGSHPVRDIMREESPMEPGPTRVPVERYFSKEFHDLEVEKVWKRVWQMACHEDDIPEVGDCYDSSMCESFSATLECELTYMPSSTRCALPQAPATA
jgi:hypothetical protein